MLVTDTATVVIHSVRLAIAITSRYLLDVAIGVARDLPQDLTVASYLQQATAFVADAFGPAPSMVDCRDRLTAAVGVRILAMFGPPQRIGPIRNPKFSRRGFVHEISYRAQVPIVDNPAFGIDRVELQARKHRTGVSADLLMDRTTATLKKILMVRVTDVLELAIIPRIVGFRKQRLAAIVGKAVVVGCGRIITVVSRAQPHIRKSIELVCHDCVVVVDGAPVAHLHLGQHMGRGG